MIENFGENPILLKIPFYREKLVRFEKSKIPFYRDPILSRIPCTGVIELITPPKLIETAQDLFENLES